MKRLLACCWMALLCACTTQEPITNPAEPATAESPPATATPATVPAVIPARPGKPDIRTLRVTMVGDIMLGTDYPQNHLPDDDGASMLQGVEHLLSAADLTIGNLEGVLLDGGTPAKQCTNPRACYLFRSPSRYAAHLKRAGFDVLSLANNHARDFGEEGRTATMRTLDEYGILHSGRVGDFATLTLNGFRVAVLAFSVTQKSNLVHDYPLAADTVRRFADSHDLVIVSFHGGAEGGDLTRLPFAEEEHFGEPRGDVVRFARLAVDSGADIVFGHGPHVVRALELYKDRLIAYSLGNFATYYGISVDGLKGIAPILDVTLDYQGRFLDGHIHSTVQVRPGGPQLDPQQRALDLLRELSHLDFADPGLRFEADGRLVRD